MKVKIIYKGKVIPEEGFAKENLLNVIQRSSAEIIAPCGGMKKCGKCLVKVSGCTKPPGNDEKKLLGAKNLGEGYRLACFVTPENGMTVEIPGNGAKDKILTGDGVEAVEVKPAIGITRIKTSVPDLEKQIPDISNLEQNTHLKVDRNNLPLLKEITAAILDSNHEPTLISYYDKITGVEHKRNGHFYGAAVDIGTTTVAVYLYNLENGEFKGVVSRLNSQKQYGADVISRINYATSEKDGLDILNRVIINQINDMVSQVASENDIIRKDIYMLAIAGNTTMMHLLMGLDPINIGKMPFVPVSTEMHDFPAHELGIRINKFGHALCLPSVSAYIGADIIAGMLACRIHENEKIGLLVDIGTNGEMVLGNKDRLISCSTAAGPAFEGANIKYGTGGISGAIDTMKIVEEEVVFTTIDDKKPLGICGSGIVDAVAMLLDNDIIDETGRFYDDDEIDVSDKLNSRIHEMDNMKAFRITDEISITQKDVREIQNAKAALAAGISTLIKKYGIRADDVSAIYLAGGFGNYINVKSAITIGLLPKIGEDRVIASGNTAGAGASLSLLSHDFIDMAVDLKKRIEYIELTTDPGFTNEYIDNMIF